MARARLSSADLSKTNANCQFANRDLAAQVHHGYALLIYALLMLDIKGDLSIDVLTIKDFTVDVFEPILAFPSQVQEKSLLCVLKETARFVILNS